MFTVTDGRDRNFGVDFIFTLLLFLSKELGTHLIFSITDMLVHL